MAFGRWFPLDQAAANAPATPGVVQVRLARGLIDYPTGRSAMIHYAAAVDLRQAVAELARAHPGREWLCRFADPEPGTGARGGPDVMLSELLTAFRRRFGAPPGFPE
ncbi:MAG TPA: hypothetical protein VK698_13205 [Kofleriaceae bacterium]|nr:hypothetical protein [Kofleriaceae bacterium]